MSKVEMSAEVVSLVATFAAGLAVWVLDTVALGVSVWSHDIGLVTKYREGILQAMHSRLSSRGVAPPSSEPGCQDTALGDPSSHRGVLCVSILSALVVLAGFTDVAVLALLPTGQRSSLQSVEGDGTCSLFSGSVVSTFPEETYTAQQLSSGSGGTTVTEDLRFEDFIGAVPPAGSDHGVTVDIFYDSFSNDIPDSIVYTGLDARPSGSVSFSVDSRSSHLRALHLEVTDGSGSLGDLSFPTEVLSDGFTSSVDFLIVSGGLQHSTTLVTRSFLHDEPGEYTRGEYPIDFAEEFFDWFSDQTSLDLLDTLPVSELAAAIEERIHLTGTQMLLTLRASTKTAGIGSSGSTSYVSSVLLPIDQTNFGDDGGPWLVASGGVVVEALAFSTSREAGSGAAVSLPISRCNASALSGEESLLNLGALMFCDGSIEPATVGDLFEEGVGPSLTVLSTGKGFFTDYYARALSFFGVPPLSQVYRNLTVEDPDGGSPGEEVFVVRREVSGLCEHDTQTVRTVYLVDRWAVGTIFFVLSVVALGCVVFRRRVASVYTAHSWDLVASQVVADGKCAANSTCMANPIRPILSGGHTHVYIAGVPLGPPLRRNKSATKLRWRHQTSSTPRPALTPGPVSPPEPVYS